MVIATSIIILLFQLTESVSFNLIQLGLEFFLSTGTSTVVLCSIFSNLSGTESSLEKSIYILSFLYHLSHLFQKALYGNTLLH